MGGVQHPIDIEPLPRPELEDAVDELTVLLRSCVDGGASLGFLAPLREPEAAAYWSSLGPDLESGEVTLLVAREGRSIVGTGQLRFETKPNGRHRAEVRKVMVLPPRRRRGVAAALMKALEDVARERSIRLLVLDTTDGSGGARGFYESLDYIYAGGIPDFALDPDGRPEKNAIYFKTLASAPTTTSG